MIKLLVEERESAETREALQGAGAIATSTVSYVESRAALARMRAGRRIDARRQKAAAQLLDEIWLDVLSVPTDDATLASAADLADAHSLRGYDSIQLAAAVSLLEADQVLFACWDAELNVAAAKAGLRTLA